MNASKARRRWLKWCRYAAATQTQANPKERYHIESHAGQIKAYSDVMYAQRYYPKGARDVWFPRWESVR